MSTHVGARGRLNEVPTHLKPSPSLQVTAVQLKQRKSSPSPQSTDIFPSDVVAAEAQAQLEATAALAAISKTSTHRLVRKPSFYVRYEQKQQALAEDEAQEPERRESIDSRHEELEDLAKDAPQEADHRQVDGIQIQAVGEERFERSASDARIESCLVDQRQVDEIKSVQFRHVSDGKHQGKGGGEVAEMDRIDEKVRWSFLTPVKRVGQKLNLTVKKVGLTQVLLGGLCLVSMWTYFRTTWENDKYVVGSALMSARWIAVGGLHLLFRLALTPFVYMAWCHGLIFEITGMGEMFRRGAATGSAAISSSTTYSAENKSGQIDPVAGESNATQLPLPAGASIVGTVFVRDGSVQVTFDREAQYANDNEAIWKSTLEHCAPRIVKAVGESFEDSTSSLQNKLDADNIRWSGHKFRCNVKLPSTPSQP